MQDFLLKLCVFTSFLSAFPGGASAHVHPCGIRLARYRFNKEPAEYGVYGGMYAHNKPSFVALAVDMFVLISGRLQTCPPGFLYPVFTNAGKTSFANDSKTEVYYLLHNRRHKYRWVESKDGERVPFAIDFGTHLHGVPNYFGRVHVNGFWRFGPVSAIHGCMVYPGDEGVYSKSNKYQVLTCRSSRCHEPPANWPNMPVSGELPAPQGGCVHNWVAYNNETSINAVSAGEFDCGNQAYVGKAPASGYLFPGRLQTVGNRGIYLSQNGMPALVTNGTFYLHDNPNYSYSWINYEGAAPPNAVRVGNPGKPFFMTVGRVKVNGRAQLGYVIDPTLSISRPNGPDDLYNNFEILVCDPWPKFQCAQQWRKYNLDEAPSTDGFSVGTYTGDVVSYIGRGTSKRTNGCDFDIGRIRIGFGLYALDQWTASERLDNVTAEYLVKNASYTYKWTQSRDGVRVVNALELQSGCHAPFFIGKTKVNDNFFVGKVVPGEGLVYADLDGSLRSVSDYEVLTCTQPDDSLSLYRERSAHDWYQHECPKREDFFENEKFF